VSEGPSAWAADQFVVLNWELKPSTALANCPPLAVKVLPVPTVTLPALLNTAPVGKFLPFWMVKLPVAVLRLKFARALAPFWLTSFEPDPSSTRVAALVRMSALLIWSVPATR
jgi:hypothetical protein